MLPLDALPEDALVDAEADPLANVVLAEEHRVLAAALRTLSELDRAVVLAEDGADPLGGRGDHVSRSAWKSRRFRVRRHLKEVVEGLGAPS